MRLSQVLKSLDAKVFAKKRYAKQPCKGLSLVDGVLAILLLAILVLGTSSFRYHSVNNLQKADFQDSASRTAELLCQSWKGVIGIESFDPMALLGTAVNIVEAEGISDTDPLWPAGFTLVETFKITMNSAPYYVALGYRDIQTGLRALTIIVSWAQRVPSGGEWQTVTFNETDKLYRLTTYVTTE